MTQPQAASVLSASTAKITKMERGWVPIRDPDIRSLCDLYGVTDPDTVGGLLELARVDRERRKAKGWWNDFPHMGAMHEYVALENAAKLIRAWQICYIPGLLQEPDYMRALVNYGSTDDRPDGGEGLVSSRTERQKRLTDEQPLHFHALIHESAMRHLVGGPDIMRQQLRRLVAESQRPHVTIQIVPFSAGSHAGMGGAFNILSFTEPGAMDVVYTETALGQLWVEGGDKAAEHTSMFTSITQRALDAEQSRAFIESACKELEQ